jgi:hypothetical protein
MQPRDIGRIQDRLINRLDRLEKRESFQRSRLFQFKMDEIHNRLSQKLLMEKIIETENFSAVSAEILTGLKKAIKTSEFDFRYFVSPIRNLVPKPNPVSLYMTQYILEIVFNHPDVIDIYGTDEDIYRQIDKVISQVKEEFERTEKEVMADLARNKNLIPGTREYEIVLHQMLVKKVGEPQKI